MAETFRTSLAQFEAHVAIATRERTPASVFPLDNNADF